MIVLVGLYLIYHAFKHKNERDKSVKSLKKSEVAVAFSAGVVPCPGVMTIVLFCIVLKHYFLGVLAAIFMSIGMGFTVSLIGILSIYANKKSNNFLKTKGYILEIFSGVLILLLGLFLGLS
jgi:ABC-type nickel/cobalt efflux system permease component RcnA